MKIVTWNVNGLRSVFGKERQPFHRLLDKEAPDILCLQEIKCNEKQVEHIVEYMAQLHGYTAVINSAEKAGYSGTAIFSKHPFKRLDDRRMLKFSIWRTSDVLNNTTDDITPFNTIGSNYILHCTH